MATRVKATLKRFIIRWELWLYGGAAVAYVAAVPTLVLVFPDVSNLWVSVFILASGLLNTLAATASAIKSTDSEA